MFLCVLGGEALCSAAFGSGAPLRIIVTHVSVEVAIWHFSECRSYDQVQQSS